MISIVIAAYNAAPFIGICINSCLSLMEAEAEIIVINDGSTDNTLTICNQMASRHSNILFSHRIIKVLVQHAMKGF